MITFNKLSHLRQLKFLKSPCLDLIFQFNLPIYFNYLLCARLYTKLIHPHENFFEQKQWRKTHVILTWYADVGWTLKAIFSVRKRCWTTALHPLHTHTFPFFLVIRYILKSNGNLSIFQRQMCLIYLFFQNE